MKRPGRNPHDFATRQEVDAVLSKQNELLSQGFGAMGGDVKLTLFNLSALIDFLSSKGLFTVEEFKAFAQKSETPEVVTPA